MAIAATGPTGSDWFEANLRQVLGITGASSAGRQLSSAQLLAAFDKRYTRIVDPGSNRVTFARNGEALQLMDDPAEIDPLTATFAASQLGGPRAALATIDADSCVPGDCAGDVGRALATIRATLDALIEVSGRRNGWLQARLLVGQLVGTGDGTGADGDFGLLLRLRVRVEAGHLHAPSFPREQALSVLDLAIDAVNSFKDGMGRRIQSRRRPLHDSVETLHSCALHIADCVVEVRRTLAEQGIGQCELDRAGRDGNALPSFEDVAVSLPDLFSALETQPREWARLIDGATPDSQAAIAASAGILANMLDQLNGKGFTALFNLGPEPLERIGEAWERCRAYALAVLRDLQASLADVPGDPPAGDEALIEAPEEERTSL